MHKPDAGRMTKTPHWAERREVPRPVTNLSIALRGRHEGLGGYALDAVAEQWDTNPVMITGNREEQKEAQSAYLDALDHRHRNWHGPHPYGQVQQACVLYQSVFVNLGIEPPAYNALWHAVAPGRALDWDYLALLLLCGPRRAEALTWAENLPSFDDALAIVALRTPADRRLKK